MSKEKFELFFMAGGALLDVLNNRLRRDPTTPREDIGAAMHSLAEAVDRHRDQIADPEAVAGQVAAVRDLLCAESPSRLTIASYVEELATLVAPVAELADPVERLRRAVTAWLG